MSKLQEIKEWRKHKILKEEHIDYLISRCEELEEALRPVAADICGRYTYPGNCYQLEPDNKDAWCIRCRAKKVLEESND